MTLGATVSSRELGQLREWAHQAAFYAPIPAMQRSCARQGPRRRTATNGEAGRSVRYYRLPGFRDYRRLARSNHPKVTSVRAQTLKVFRPAAAGTRTGKAWD